MDIIHGKMVVYEIIHGKMERPLDASKDTLGDSQANQLRCITTEKQGHVSLCLAQQTQQHKHVY